MPSLARQVGFASTRSVSRQPKEDEHLAMYGFARHASHCERCADPYRVHLAGKTLCDRGHHHARQVARYLFNKDGRACSTVDGDDLQSVQIEIPKGYDAVRELLRAIERGLRLRRAKSASSAPIVSYDRTYYVQPRRRERAADRPRVEIVEPPRGHHEDGKVIYIHRDGTPYETSPYDEPTVIYATPRQQNRRYGQEEFYN